MGFAPDIPDSVLGNAATLSPGPDDLVVFVLNVGDGDSVVIMFPEKDGSRVFGIVDSNNSGKSLDLLRKLHQGPGNIPVRFMCATHPHYDHMRGLRPMLRATDVDFEEYWDSGFRYTSKTYHDLIKEVATSRAQFFRPTSGFQAFIKNVRLTVLSPSIVLRNRYDTYGIDANNGSIVLRLDYPVESALADFPREDPSDSQPAKINTRTMILGGDAQTDAWSRVVEEFPHLDKDNTNWAREIDVRHGRQPLFCDVLKVSHHCSKHGINLELVERMGDRSGSSLGKGPRFMISSCADGRRSRHGFPHAVAQEIMREVRNPQARSGGTHLPDHELGIHYTSQRIDNGQLPKPLAGSVAVVFNGTGRTPKVYRMGDGGSSFVDLTNARQVL